MKQILVMIITVVAVLVLVGCSEDTRKSTPAPSASKNIIADNIVDKAIRKELGKPISVLTNADLEKVTFLNLHRTQITDASLKEVAKLQKLERLWLFGTQITDVGLKDVAKLQKLTHLDLRRTKITDEGLKEVAKWQQLERLSLEITQVTEAGVGKLQTALPNCEITGP